MARGADASWDLRNYHYYNGYAAWTGRLGFDYAPAQVQTYYNPFLDVPFYLLIETLRPVHVGFILGILHGINAWLVFRIALRVLRPRADGCRNWAIVLTAVGMGGAGALLELGTMLHDLTLTPLVLGSVLLLIRMHDRPSGSIAPLLGSGLLLGIAAGLKYTFGLYVPGMALAAMWLAGSGWRRRLSSVLPWTAAVGVAFAATAGPWMLELWLRYGTPTGPYFNAIFGSSYFDPKNFTDTRFLPKTALQAVAFPFYMLYARVPIAAEDRFREARFAVLYVLVVVLLVKVIHERLARQRPASPTTAAARTAAPVEAALAVFTIVSYVLWQKSFAIYRYLIPLELLAPIMISIFVGWLVGSQRRRTIVLATLLVAVVLVGKPLRQPRRAWGSDFFGTRVSQAAASPTSLLLIASYEPLAFAGPAFPPTMRLVRIQSNFFSPDKETRLAAEVRAVVSAHRGPFRLLSHAKHRVQAERALSAYDLRIDGEGCAPLINRVDDGVELCVVGRHE